MTNSITTTPHITQRPPPATRQTQPHSAAPPIVIMPVSKHRARGQGALSEVQVENTAAVVLSAFPPGKTAHFPKSFRFRFKFRFITHSSKMSPTGESTTRAKTSHSKEVHPQQWDGVEGLLLHRHNGKVWQVLGHLGSQAHTGVVWLPSCWRFATWGGLLMDRGRWPRAKQMTTAVYLRKENASLP